MKPWRTPLTACLAAAMAIAPALNALEVTAGNPGKPSRVDSVVNMKMQSLKAATNAVLNDQQQTLLAIMDCSKQRKLWDGTRCVSPDMTLEFPDVADPVVIDATYYAGAQFAGRCDSSRTKFKYQCKCREPAGSTYEIFPNLGPNGTIKIRTVVCRPASRYGCEGDTPRC